MQLMTYIAYGFSFFMTFRGDKYKCSFRLTAINVTNKVALYNFLSTFSGTHFLTPRTYTAELGLHF